MAPDLVEEGNTTTVEQQVPCRDNEGDEESSEVEQESLAVDENPVWKVLRQTPNSHDLDGREAGLRKLIQCYEKQCLQEEPEDRGIVLITGISGTGKTVLARALQPVVQKDHGFFIYGKCDQLEKNNTTTIPYAPFADAFASLVGDVLRRGAPLKQRLCEAVTDVTHDTGGALLDTFPALKRLPIPIPAGASSNAFAECNQRVISAALSQVLHKFCSPEHPLVCFLDDLQWLSPACLKLFQSLALERIPSFLLLGTCRGNEVALQDPLAVALRSIEDQHVTITDIRLKNLSESALQSLLKDKLQLDSKPLAELIHRQTGGNLFMALQLLRNLCDINVLEFDEDLHQWTYPKAMDGSESTSHLQQLVPDDCGTLVAAIITTIQRTSPPVVEQVLSVAACLGAEFAQSVVVAAIDEDSNTIREALNILEQKGIIISSTSNDNNTATHFRWVHDRFQQVAYELIPPEQQAACHSLLGSQLLNKLSPNELQSNPFVVVNQFCHPAATRSKEELLSKDAASKLAKLCLLAGQRASASSAFDCAAAYFQLGIDVLGSSTSIGDDMASSQQSHATRATAHVHNLLEHDYKNGMALLNSLAYAECCVGNFKAVDELVGLILDHPKTQIQDRLKAYEIHVYSLGSRQDLDGAVRLGFKVLRELLGEVYPRQPTFFQVATQVVITKLRLSFKKEADILNLKPMTNWRKLAACRIMHLIYPPCVRVAPQLSVLLLTRGIALTLKWGLSTLSQLLLNGFAMLVCHPLGDIREGRRLAEIGMQLVNKEEYNSLSVRCRILLCYWGFTKGWFCPVQDCLQPLNAAARIGNITGDIEMVCFSYFIHINIAFLASGTPLLQLAEEFAELNQMFAERHQETVLFFLRISQQALQCLREPAKAVDEKCEVSGDFFRETSGLEQARGVGDELGITTIFIFKCFLAVYFNKPQQALAASKQLRKCTTDGFTVVLVYQAVFLGGLAEVMAARESKKKRIRAGKAAIRKLKRYALASPENVQNKILLIQAHRAALCGQWGIAFAKFDLSIHYAQQSGFLGEECLACEQAALAHFEGGEHDAGVVQLRRCKSLYERWGSLAKVEQIAALLQEKSA